MRAMALNDSRLMNRFFTTIATYANTKTIATSDVITAFAFPTK